MKAYLLMLSLALGMPNCFAETPVVTEQSDKIGKSVSLTNLVATPERYEGKLVYVVGYISIGLENMSLCPSKKPLSRKDCIWLTIDSGPFETDEDIKRFTEKEKRLKPFNGQVVSVRGVFDSHDTGHFGMWSGAIRNIIEVSAMKSRATATFDSESQ